MELLQIDLKKMEDIHMKKALIGAMTLAMLGTCTAFAGETETEEVKPLEGETLTIALSPDFMYFETVSETEECGYEGLDIDIIKSLSDKLGFEFEIVPMSFSSLIGSLQTGNADFVISGMSYTEERAEVVDFSITYCTTDVGCVVPVDSEIASYEDLEDQIIACSQGTTYEMLIDDIPGATLKTYQGQAAVGTAVSQNSDGVVAGLTSCNGAKKLANTVLDTDNEPLLKYFVLEGEGVADQYNIAFPKDSELVEVFDEAIQEMIDSGEMEEMIQYWLY
jgi:ABC-type amino acid transport substrate-binding protein